MDERIDLTLNRDFRKKINKSILSRLIIGKARYPWSTKTTLHSLDFSEKELFFTGDRETRKNKLRHQEMEQNYGGMYECDRCGRLINNLPWSKFKTLCKSCDEYITSPIERFPWSIRLRR